jgi:hypothetical protein
MRSPFDLVLRLTERPDLLGALDDVRTSLMSTYYNRFAIVNTW